MERMPHDGVYARIGRSKIHGVGVFAICAIKKGTNIFAGDNTKMIWVPAGKLRGLPKEIQKLYKDFGVLKNGRYGVPRNFNQLTPAWYVNNSSTPNLWCDKNYNFIATRNIKKGKELTLRYSTYSEDYN